MLTSAVLQMALIWDLTARTGSAAVLSLASIAGFLPSALLGSFAGTMVDRWNRKHVMITADLFIAGVSVMIVVFSAMGEPPIWLVLAVLCLRSVGTAFHTPALSAVTPLIVPPEELTKCAGYSQAVETLGYIAGTALAALLYPLWGIPGMVALDVLGALAACFTVVLVQIPPPPRQERAGRPNVLAEMREGYRAIRAHKGLFALLWIGAVFMVFYAPVSALFPLLSMDWFGGTTTHTAVAEIAFSLGMLGGGMALGARGGFRDRAVSMVGAVLLLGAATAVSGLLPRGGFWVFAALCVLMGISVPFYSGPQMALLQERIAPEFLGRVFGLYSSVMSLAMPLGLSVSGLLADRIGVNGWFLICGIACTLLALLTWFIPSIRHIDRKPQLPDAAVG